MCLLCAHEISGLTDMTKFQPGQSGNPAGRPPAPLDRRTIFREVVLGHGEAIVQKATELALDGDKDMIKLIMPMIIPKALTEEYFKNQQYFMKCVLEKASSAEKAKEIFSQMTQGNVSTSTGSIFLDALQKTQMVNLCSVVDDVEKLKESKDEVSQIKQENAILKAKLAEMEKKSNV